ncbi:MAG: hypothetical protein GY854_21280 [Deltaproteobacteria bacterium]|nr:hypothetical protein [Deltaproteobacteria bacterium]
MMRKVGLFAGLLIVASTAGCAGSGQVCEKEPTRGYDVIFSLANQDRRAPIVVMDIIVDGDTLFHGMIPSSRGGDYQYIRTQVPRQKIDLEIRSKAEGEVITAGKKVFVKDHLWVIVTRQREFDGEPEIQIDLSYEKPRFVPEGR